MWFLVPVLVSLVLLWARPLGQSLVLTSVGTPHYPHMSRSFSDAARTSAITSNMTFSDIALPGHFSCRHEFIREVVDPRIKNPTRYFQDRFLKEFGCTKEVLHTASGNTFLIMISKTAESQRRHTALIQKLRKEIAPQTKRTLRVLVGNCSAVNKTQLAGLLSDYGTLESLDMNNSLNSSTEYGEGAHATLLRGLDAKAIPRLIQVTALGCKWDLTL